MKKALDLGVVINLDNDFEMAIVDDLLKNECKDSKSSMIGLRINPCVGGGSISMNSTTVRASKFGLPMVDETRDKILDLYKKYEWLNSIHCHVGSQGCPLHLFINAAKVMMMAISVVIRPNLSLR